MRIAACLEREHLPVADSGGDLLPLPSKLTI